MTEDQFKRMTGWFTKYIRTEEGEYIPFGAESNNLMIQYLEETGYGVRCPERDGYGHKDWIYYRITDLGKQALKFYEL
jgi:hypothetical protein